MWQKLQVFKAVVEAGGFSKAAKALNISAPSATRLVRELEAEYNTQLLLRTTRHVSLTDSGEKFYEFVCETLEAEHDIQLVLDSQKKTVSGHLKIGVPTSLIYNCFREVPTYLLDKHPELNIQLIQGNHLFDLLNEHFDMVLHCGELPDINFYATQLGTWQKIVCASPAYIKKHGKPSRISQLSVHNCLDHAANYVGGWQLMQDKQLKVVPVKGNLQADSSMALAQFAEDGLGIVYLPHFTISRALHDGRLVPLLKGHWPESLPIFAVYSQKKASSKKIMALLEALSKFFKA